MAPSDTDVPPGRARLPCGAPAESPPRVIRDPRRSPLLQITTEDVESPATAAEDGRTPRPRLGAGTADDRALNSLLGAAETSRPVPPEAALEPRDVDLVLRPLGGLLDPEEGHGGAPLPASPMRPAAETRAPAPNEGGEAEEVRARLARPLLRLGADWATRADSGPLVFSSSSSPIWAPASTTRCGSSGGPPRSTRNSGTHTNSSWRYAR